MSNERREFVFAGTIVLAEEEIFCYLCYDAIPQGIDCVEVGDEGTLIHKACWQRVALVEIEKFLDDT